MRGVGMSLIILFYRCYLCEIKYLIDWFKLF